MHYRGLIHNYLSLESMQSKVCNCQFNHANKQLLVQTTAAAPASEGQAVVRSPTNMAATNIAAVDFNKMTSK